MPVRGWPVVSPPSTVNNCNRSSTVARSTCYSQGESGLGLIQPTTAPRQMNPAQTAAALQLLAVCENDLEMQANAKAYGNWLDHLADQLSDERIEQLTLSCKHLHPVS